MADKQAWKVGEYAMSRGMPIRVNEIDGKAVTLELVADYREGVGITCGGYCSGGGQLGDLKPITDPEMILRCRAYEAYRRIKEAKSTIVEQEKVLAAQTAGLRALQDAHKAAAEEGAANG
ncbi:hypothetical protein J2X65_003567 [Ancylobacter sp. 3268]|uniref:hypothetical protein n=1 Tax=Ancylobacter sp. 3268 TaxID=2817752 RepID=UPI002860BC40|nr:hypothetical protein [Ancylobacter sp. 3268]MDR6954199.1 hypothetical protein [Ancylobacter sp. 3268]